MDNIDEINKALLKYVSSSKSDLNFEKINFDHLHKEKIQDHICLFRELTWKEASNIDYKSFVKNKDLTYFNSEKEKREIVEKSLLKIYDLNNLELKFTSDQLSHDFVEKYWEIYQNYLHLNLKEVNEIFESSKKYFNSKNNEIFPIHPLIIQVDYMTKGIVHLSKTEFENLTVKEFEAIQLILSVKNSL